MTVANTAVTPMMAQFLEIKDVHKDALLFYRMGDFYEMFFDDAIAASAALDIALTKRGKHLGQDIPMCGVPFHAAEGYLLTLIRKGFRVAVCEQLEDPAAAKKRGAKSVLKRGVVRLVTPGTLTEDSLLEARQHNYLAAYSEVRAGAALAWVDISTGAFQVVSCPRVRLSPELARLTPRELLVSELFEAELSELVSDSGASLTALSRASFDSTAAKKRLLDFFNVGSLEAFGQFGRAELAAMGAIVDYLNITQRGKMPRLSPPTRENTDSVMQIDVATRRNLELTRALSGGRAGSLLGSIDRTVTAGGARLLERRLSSPSRYLAKIQARQDAVEFFASDTQYCEEMRRGLRNVPDMDRALSRLSLDRGGPRDLASIRNGLTEAKAIVASLSGFETPNILTSANRALADHGPVLDIIASALVTDPPYLSRDGGFIASGFDAELDDARLLRDEGRSVIVSMQIEYVSQTGISSLKIKHNNVLGYFVETTSSHADKMLSAPLSETFIHRQTTANAVRFTTLPLSEMETKILNAGNRALEIEKRLYSELVLALLDNAAEIGHAASALAEIDLSAALADLAVGEKWARPTVDNSRCFKISNGRHPVVELALRQTGVHAFIANDCCLADGSDGADIWLLTGPNMAGKSTFLRQNAIIALLAQMGSFVPADAAHIGIVSQLFSRVGASDDLAKGQSTFMVEMVETAAILNQADDRALVILDEIGRGTATYDGLSIAWATLEYLHDSSQCRAIFATHYQELTALADRLTGAQNVTVTVKEWEGEVIFLHEVRKGSADRSYGVQVARLAGLPKVVVDRARVVLDMLEKGEREGRGRQKTLIDDLPLFANISSPPSASSGKPSATDEKLAGILPDELTPKQALSLIYELKALMTQGSS